ncbi:NAD(P)/FAD-dependent oxidoreductase [bacterium]|nr:NAD(P)/FAD-dependent oxidoreductase [bacterium]
MEHSHHVVIIGGGFGGLYAAQSLKNAPVRITLIDRRNFHLFQPLLYQVATGDLSPANIASPLRVILSRQKNVKILLAEVTGFDIGNRRVITCDGDLKFDSLIVATGSANHYFGHDTWQPLAPGLKTLEDAFEIRNRMMRAYERAEKEPDPELKKEWLSFVVVGAGSTGVELAGALAEIANDTLVNDFRTIDPGYSSITLIEGMDRILPQFPEELSASAKKSLEHLGVTVLNGAMVEEITPESVTYKIGDRTERISSRTVLWTAGIKASPIGKALADSTGVELDRSGRVIVLQDCSIQGWRDVFVIGDLAHFSDPDGNPLPGLAPVAMQQGRYVAKLIEGRMKGESKLGFRYRDFGTMSILGRNSAVAMIDGLRFSGWFAWFLWLFVHLRGIIQFGNKLLILTQWAWKYFTRDHYAGFITTNETNESDDDFCKYCGK